MRAWNVSHSHWHRSINRQRTGGDRPFLNGLDQRRPVQGVQPRRLPGPLAVDQAGRAMRVELQHSVPHHLNRDAADGRGFGPRVAAPS